MRILHLGKFWSKEGGIERHVFELCNGLSQKNIEVINIVNTHHKYEKIEYGKHLSVYKVPYAFRFFGSYINPNILLLCKKLHSENPFDIIHIHLPEPMSHLTTLLIGRNIPIVVTWHSDIIRQRTLFRLYRPFLIQLIKKASKIVASSRLHFENSEILSKYAKANQKQIIPYGFDGDRFDLGKCSDEKISELKDGRKNIIFALGRHVKYKGFNNLILAMKNFDGFLYLGGQGPETKKLKKLAEDISVSHKIHFANYIEEKELVNYYHACDIFALPSIGKNEAFGIVQVEAMYCKKPVVSCFLGNAVNEVNKHMETGLVVKPNAPDNLLEALNYLIANENLRIQFGRNGFEKVSKDHSLETMITEHIELYSTLLDQS